MDILYINHEKSQCGVYEIGKRIYGLLNPNIIQSLYFETKVDGINEYRNIMEEHKPKYVFYNFYFATLPYLNKNLFKEYPNTKHIGIVHDPLRPSDIQFYESTFDAWIIHDDTNPIQSKNKFTTIRPISRFNKPESNNKILNIGSHGFTVSPWKMFDKMIDQIHHEFDEVNINMNLTQATFGGSNQGNEIDMWRSKITKPNVKLNITTHYFEEEIDLISFLSKNDLNMYFYNTPNEYVGVGGSADLAVSSQSSLLVNSSYMYRHFHKHIGYFEQFNKINPFLENNLKVKELYELWSPDRMTSDYKNLLESL
jgi:hypothetical protein